MSKTRKLAGLAGLLALGATGNALGAEPTLADRRAAAQAAAVAPPCRGLSFYWEIGDAGGRLGSGDGTGAKVDTGRVGYIASAGKWLYGAYVIEKRGGSLLPADIKLLNFTGGYSEIQYCSAGASGDTVERCGNADNNPQDPDTVGRFFYDSGHMQAHGATVAAMGIKDLKSAAYVKRGTPDQAFEALGTVIGRTLGLPKLDYDGVVLAGNARMDTNSYTDFLRRILSGSLKMRNYLDADKVCASDNNELYFPRSTDMPCPQTGTGVALYSPPDAPPDREQWHYAAGHWIESDGTYSSPGAFGFYPWINNQKNLYGVVARYGFPNLGAYEASFQCGRVIRNAWLNAAGSP